MATTDNTNGGNGQLLAHLDERTKNIQETLNILREENKTQHNDAIILISKVTDRVTALEIDNGKIKERMTIYQGVQLSVSMIGSILASIFKLGGGG